VAIERPDGPLVEAMLDAGIVVLAVHPNQVKAARPRFRSAGKPDGFDAYVLAELARTDRHRLRPVRPDSDATRALRALTRARADLVGMRVGLANQLRDHLERFWPGAVEIFSEVDSPIALSFLERYPAPADAEELDAARLRAFLAGSHYCGRRPPEALLARLRRAGEVRLGALESEARRGVVLGLCAALRPVVAEIRRLTAQIAHALAEHPDGATFRSLFRDPRSVVTAAALLAEIGDVRERYPTRHALMADAGMCPVAVESGRSATAVFRWACDKRLRDAVGVLADASRHHNLWAADLYARARARGKDHPHAIRILGRAWLAVVWRLWHDRATYDPTRHRALQVLTAMRG
jgi:transposase